MFPSMGIRMENPLEVKFTISLVDMNAGELVGINTIALGGAKIQEPDDVGSILEIVTLTNA
jgi:hypothetical protein